MLIVLGLAKLFATALLLTTGWKGGYIFPIMFASVALGMAVNLLFPGYSGGGRRRGDDGRRAGRGFEERLCLRCSSRWSWCKRRPRRDRRRRGRRRPADRIGGAAHARRAAAQPPEARRSP
jgi:hypothetical protein